MTQETPNKDQNFSVRIAQWKEFPRHLASERELRMYDTADALISDMQAEIERIKQNHGCARHQRTTQFCAEAVAKDAEIAELEGLLGEALASFKCTQRVESYPPDSWPHRVTAALAEKGE